MPDVVLFKVEDVGGRPEAVAHKVLSETASRYYLTPTRKNGKKDVDYVAKSVNGGPWSGVFYATPEEAMERWVAWAARRLEEAEATLARLRPLLAALDAPAPKKKPRKKGG